MVAAFLDIMDFRLIRWIEVQHEVGGGSSTSYAELPQELKS